MRALIGAAITVFLGVGLSGAAQPRHLTVSGTEFRAAEGRPFAWRGITAFRLAEFVAHGREPEADRYLAWAASKQLTVVRVLAMADGLFSLSPEDGRRALPRLLDLAAKRGLYVEVVALADTAAIEVSLERHVAAIGEICGRAENCLIEIANEPSHPTQARALHDPRVVRKLATLVPSGVPVSLGSVEAGDGYGQGTYVTWHPPRTNWVERLDEGAALLRRFRKPVVADEPIGAAARSIPGRRDNAPSRFAAAAKKLKALGLGATFHYEGGLQARRPDPVELACLDEWLSFLLDNSPK